MIIREGSGKHYSPYNYYLKTDDGLMLIATDSENDDLEDMGEMFDSDSLQGCDTLHIDIDEYKNMDARIKIPYRIIERLL